MVKMENDANWLVIRIPRMYADKVHDVSISRILSEATRVADALYDGEAAHTGEQWNDVLEAYHANREELEDIRQAVDSFASAVREGLQLEANNT